MGAELKYFMLESSFASIFDEYTVCGNSCILCRAKLNPATALEQKRTTVIIKSSWFCHNWCSLVETLCKVDSSVTWTDSVVWKWHFLQRATVLFHFIESDQPRGSLIEDRAVGAISIFPYPSLRFHCVLSLCDVHCIAVQLASRTRISFGVTVYFLPFWPWKTHCCTTLSISIVRSADDL